MDEKCECHIISGHKLHNDGSLSNTFTISYCPLHAAAPEFVNHRNQARGRTGITDCYCKLVQCVLLSKLSTWANLPEAYKQIWFFSLA